MKTSDGQVRTCGADDAHTHIDTHRLMAGDFFPVTVCVHKVKLRQL